ncbi:hypothetical protein HN51_007948 [Arachis hypogaea]|uniref:Ninja-family protein n=2 Tax=Arachis TaxID=3817 RepID=A0A6P4DEN3_ARADU|nr:ninja-family protein AFP3 [Arachis duranensis]QHO42190.1 Ninja-family protein [Arachis hypogaea]
MLNHRHFHPHPYHHHQMENYPRDLLQRFVDVSTSAGSTSEDITQTLQEQQHHQQAKEYVEEKEAEDADEEVELNLGLSLGGRFGVDKDAKKKLTRSSSIVGTMPLFREDRPMEPPHVAAYPAALMRTSSLPTETEEEWRKRKELQTLRRMEAKRRRSEKQRVARTEKESGGGAGAGIGSGLEELEGGAGASATSMGLNRFGSSNLAVQPFGVPNWGARQVVLGDVLGKGKIGDSGGFQGLFAQPSSQCSAESQGGSSSSVSEMESKPFLGPSSCGEARSPASNQSLQERRSSQDAVGGSGAKTNENVSRSSRAEMDNPSKKPNKAREIGTNSMEDMPCVFTKGDGPNGKRIEGILYKYGKGEEVRIMCVCHGDFLSPAEFVKHAGGGDVAHPLRHIVVNPSAAPFL